MADFRSLNERPVEATDEAHTSVEVCGFYRTTLRLL